MPGLSDRLSLARIGRAAREIDPRFRGSPQFAAEPLSGELGVRVVVKVETVNPVGSFKGRGAEFFLAEQYALIASGAGILVLLLVLPEGLGGGLYRLRDLALRRIATRRGLVVPSLLADRRGADVEPDELPVATGLLAGDDTSEADEADRAPVGVA